MSERLRGLRNFIDQKICGRKKDPDLNTLPTCLPADPSIKSGQKNANTPDEVLLDPNNDEILREGRSPKRRRPPEKAYDLQLDDDERQAEELFGVDSGDLLQINDEQTIFLAIKMQDYETLMEFLGDKEIDVNVITSEGKRYLHECVVYDDLEACEMFLNAGSDVDAQDIHGWTALHFAAAFNLNDMTQLLLDRGADTAKLTSEGKTAVEYTEDQHLIQKIEVASTLRGLRSVSSLSSQ